MSPCDLAIEVHGPEGVRAALGVYRLFLLRWQRWRTDAQLGAGLGEWIAAHGSDAPLRAEQVRRAADREHTRATDEARARWTAAMPDPLRDVWARVATVEVVHDARADAADLEPALAALRAAPDPGALPRALLVWLGLQTTVGTGWPGEELLAHRLARAFLSDEALAAALVDAPPAVVAGVRSFLEWHRAFRAPPKRPVRAYRRFKALHDVLVERLTAVCPDVRSRGHHLDVHPFHRLVGRPGSATLGFEASQWVRLFRS